MKLQSLLGLIFLLIAGLFFSRWQLSTGDTQLPRENLDIQVDEGDAFSYLTSDILANIGGDKTTCADGSPRRQLGETCNDGDSTTRFDVVSYFGCGCQGVVQICEDGSEPGTPGEACEGSDLVVSSDGCRCVQGVSIGGSMFATQSADLAQGSHSGSKDGGQSGHGGLVDDGHSGSKDGGHSGHGGLVDGGAGPGGEEAQSGDFMSNCSSSVDCDGWMIHLAHDVPVDAPFVLKGEDGTVYITGSFTASTNTPNMLMGSWDIAPDCGEKLTVDLTWTQGSVTGIREIPAGEMPCECIPTQATVCDNGKKPLTPGSSCNDGNEATQNDTIQEDGCSCAGLIVDQAEPTCGDGEINQDSEKCDDGDNNVTSAAGLTPGTYCMECQLLSIDPAPTPVCGEDGFDHETDEDEQTTCSIPEDACVPEAGSSCEYCNEVCEKIEVTKVCDAIACPGLASCEAGTEPGAGTPAQFDENGCQTVCAIAACVCIGTDETPKTPGDVCDDGDENTNDDVIQEDGCSCAGLVVEQVEPVCGDGEINQDSEKCDDGDNNITSAGGLSSGTYCMECQILVIDPAPADPVCGEDGFDHETDDDDTTTCSTPEDVCAPEAGSSCEYCNDACELATIHEECAPIACPDYAACPEAQEYGAGNSAVIDANGCQTACATFGPCVCSDTMQEPKTPGESCDDGDSNTDNDIIQSDGCSCMGTEVEEAPTWVVGEYSCSVLCGEGTATRSVDCSDSDGVKVDDSLCTETKPDMTETCVLDACEEYEWFTGESGNCSELCGGGVQHRTVQCRQMSDNAIVDPSMCDENSMPMEEVICNEQICESYERETDEWSACNETCGGGSHSRSVRCVRVSDETVVQQSYCETAKPLSVESCNTQVCEIYNRKETDRSSCSKVCDTGEQTKVVTCINASGKQVDEDMCTGTMPESYRVCNTQACETYEWKTDDRTECNVSCGGGTQVRDVDCVSTSGGGVVSTALCEGAAPTTSRSCNTSACEHQVSQHSGGGGGGRAIARAYCGDGEVNQETEQCDDGNYVDGDGCSRFCTLEVSEKEILPAPVLEVSLCGDGKINQDSEECDDGNSRDNDGCSNQCLLQTLKVCGDGSVNQLSEECDDGNLRNGDNCSSTCKIEQDESIISDILLRQDTLGLDTETSTNLPIDISFTPPSLLPKTGTWSIATHPYVGASSLMIKFLVRVSEHIVHR